MKKYPSYFPLPTPAPGTVFLDLHVDSSQADKIRSFLAEPSVWGGILYSPKCQELT